MDLLQILNQDRQKWINVVISLGCPKDYAEDVVQDMYIKIATMKNPRKIMYNETEVNYWYVILALRSVCYDFMKWESKYVVSDIVEEADDPFSMEEQLAFERLYEKVKDEANGFGKYGARLVQVYFKTDYSIRGLAAESTISVTSIYNSIKQYRAILREKLGEDYEDYINGDYDKV